jgi:hypothetical protein
MFNLFKKKEPYVPVVDRVLMSEEGKLNALFREWSAENKSVFIFWFEESLDKAAIYFAGHTNIPVNLIMAREASHLKDKKIFFAEHHPLNNKEQELFQKLSLPVAYVYSSMDEPLFKLFGGDRIVTLMKQLGLKEDEVIEHKMISNSISQAQKKIGKKVVIDHSATSQEAWIKKMTIA